MVKNIKTNRGGSGIVVIATIATVAILGGVIFYTTQPDKVIVLEPEDTAILAEDKPDVKKDVQIGIENINTFFGESIEPKVIPIEEENLTALEASDTSANQENIRTPKELEEFPDGIPDLEF